MATTQKTVAVEEMQDNHKCLLYWHARNMHSIPVVAGNVTDRVILYPGYNSVDSIYLDSIFRECKDIIDSGLTIHQLKAHMRGLGAASIRVASMLFKPNRLEFEDAKPDYVGHEITDEFVVGYGLDFDGFVRNLDAIYKVKEHSA